MALDDIAKRLFVVCRHPAKFIILDTTSCRISPVCRRLVTLMTFFMITAEQSNLRIVGAFLAGLAVNAVHDKPAKEKLEFSGNFFFIPYLLYRDRVPDRSDRIRSVHHYQFPIGVSGHRALLIGKWIAHKLSVVPSPILRPRARRCGHSRSRRWRRYSQPRWRLRYSKSRQSTPD